MPARWLSQYSLWNGRSVGSCWVTWYCTGVSDCRSSASLGFVSRAVVAELAVGLGRIDVVPERVHQPLVPDLSGIVHHLHRLEVSRLTGGHLLVRRARCMAPRVAHGDGYDAIDLVEGALHRPEAAA